MQRKTKLAPTSTMLALAIAALSFGAASCRSSSSSANAATCASPGSCADANANETLAAAALDASQAPEREDAGIILDAGAPADAGIVDIEE